MHHIQPTNKLVLLLLGLVLPILLANTVTAQICDRSDRIEILLLLELNITDCNSVTASDLSGISGALNWQEQNITELTALDFDELNAVTEFDLSNNKLNAIVDDTMDGTKPSVISFANNNISIIEPDALLTSGSTNSDIFYDLSGNNLVYSNLQNNFLNPLSAHGNNLAIDLSNNSINFLHRVHLDFSPNLLNLSYNQLGVNGAINFDSLDNIGYVDPDGYDKSIDLSHNQLSVFHTGNGGFFYKDRWGYIYLSHNKLVTLPNKLLEDSNKIRHIDFGYNLLTSFNRHSIHPDNTEYAFTLILDGNPLTLSANTFQAKKISNLYLRNANLTDIPANTFQNINNVDAIYLNNNNITTLVTNAFNGAAGLDALYLNNNSITSIQANAFGNANNLDQLYLNDNQIFNLAANLFASLTDLDVLDLSNNNIPTLLADTFTNLTALDIDLSGNPIAFIPKNLLVSHPNPSQITNFDISGNSLTNNIWEITDASWVEGAANSYTLAINHSLPEDMTIELSSTSGNLNSTTITIAKGDLISTAVQWTAISASDQIHLLPVNSTFAVTSLSGYINIPEQGTAPLISANVCGRKQAIIDVLLIATGVAQCADITTADLAVVATDLNFSNVFLPAIGTPDFDYLYAVMHLDVSNNNITALTDNIFQLATPSSISLASNNIAQIATNALVTTTSPNNNVDYNLSNNAITSATLSSGFLKSLKSQNFPNKSIDLSFNNITTLARSSLDVFTTNLNLSNNQIVDFAVDALYDLRLAGIDMVLDLSYNQLSNIAARSLFGESLGQVDLSYNQIHTLAPEAIYSGVDLTLLDLGYNLISDFNASSIHQTNNPNAQLDLVLDGNPLVLKANNFAGLDLDYVYIRNSNLTTIPTDTFAGATNINRIFLTGTNLTVLETGSFSSAPGLDFLYLNNNQITTIPVDAFGTISSLTRIYLGVNNLTAVQPNTFSGVTNLQTLSINSNQLTAVPVNILGNNASLTTFRLQDNNIANLSGISFSEYTSLTELNLGDNQIPTLTADNFKGMTATRIYLRNNQISSLPLNLLLEHNNPASITAFDLSGNLLTDDSWEITNVSWIESPNNSYALQIGHALPTAITINIASTTGSLSANSITIQSGETLSSSIVWTADEGQEEVHLAPSNAKITVASLSGYINVAELGTAFLFHPNVCNRQQSIIDVLLNATGAAQCSDITSNQMLAITQTLDLSSLDLQLINAGDLDYLYNVSHFDLSANNLSVLQFNTFAETDPESISLANNNLSLFQFSALTTSTSPNNNVDYNLSNNAITSTTLSSGFLNSLKAASHPNKSFDLSYNNISTLNKADLDFYTTNLNLSHNQITDFPSNTLRNFHLTNIDVVIDLSHNLLSNIATQSFFGNSLTQVNVSNNQIATLAQDAIIFGERLSELDLSHNQISDFNASSINQNPSALEVTLDLYLNGNPLNLKAQNFAGLSIKNLYLNNITEDTIPALAFAGINNLSNVYLSNGNISTLSVDSFANATGLKKLYLDGNQLANLPAGFTATLSELELLDLSNNNLTTLQGSEFQGMMATDIDISANQLTALPINLLLQHGNLTNITSFNVADNQLANDSWEITNASWIESPNNSYALQIGHALPTAITINIASTRGSLSANSITIQSGETLSSSIVWTADEGQDEVHLAPSNAKITVASLSGYINVAEIGTAFLFNPNVCNRQQSIIDVLLNATGAAQCSDITSNQMLAITQTLDLSSLDLQLINEGDLDYLYNVSHFDLSANNLSVLQFNTFAETDPESISLANNNLSFFQFSALTTSTSPDNNIAYNLSNNAISSTTLASGILTQLKSSTHPNKSFDFSNNNITTLHQTYFNVYASLLNLSSNQITSFPTNAFTNLMLAGNDIMLDLSHNQLTGLSSDFIATGMGLAHLYLHNNSITTVDSDAFAQLTDLTTLDLSGNQIAAIPQGLFDNLSVEVIDLSDNQFTVLPKNLLLAHTNPSAITDFDISGNNLQGNSWEITNTVWQEAADGSFSLQIDHTLPAFSFDISSTSGAINTSAMSVPAGSLTSSTSVSWIPNNIGNSLDLTGTVNIPLLSGYINLDSYQMIGICDRDAGIAAALLAAANKSDCSKVAIVELLQLPSNINFNSRGVSQIATNDFLHLEIDDELDLANNMLTAIGDNVLQLIDPATVLLSHNNITQIAQNALLTNSSPDNNVQYDLSNNAITDATLATGFLNPLKSLTFNEKSFDLSYNNITALDKDYLNVYAETLDFSYNQISTMPADTFTNIQRSFAGMTVDLSYNNLTSLASETFVGTTYSTLDLSYNQIAAMGANTTLNVDILNHLDLGYNQIIDFNASSIHRDADAFNIVLDLVLDGNPLTFKASNFAGLHLNDLELLYISADHIPSFTFADVSKIENIYLSNSAISTLAVDAFTNTTGLTKLYLDNNFLTTIPAGAFGNGTNLSELYLNDNQIATLGSGFAAQLNDLVIVDLSDNNLVDLQAESMQNLTATSINLSNNLISALPLNLLAGHADPATITSFDVSGNPLDNDSWEITNSSWFKDTNDSYYLAVTHPLPIDVVVPIISSNGNLNETSVTITAGEVASTKVSWTALDPLMTEVHIQATVTKFDIPQLAGFVSIQSFGTPEGVCPRTEKIQDLLLTALNLADCWAVSSADLQGINGTLAWQDNAINTLTASDLVDLTAVTTFNLANNSLTALVNDTFIVTAPDSIILAHNNIAVIAPQALFTSVAANDDVNVNLSNNAITVATLASGFLTANGNKTLVGGSFDLSFNQISSLETNSLADFNPAALYLHDNNIATIENEAFSNMSALVTLNLANNQLSSLTTDMLSGLSATDIDLTHNNITTLPLNLLINHTNPAAITAFNLSGNAITDWNITTVNWVAGDNNSYTLAIDHALPQDINIDLSSPYDLDTNIITINKGDTVSTAVQWTPQLSDDEVYIQPLTNVINIAVLAGYINLPILGTPTGFCNRTAVIRDLLTAALNQTDCANITTADLLALNGSLNWDNQNISQLTDIDLVNLINVDAFDLSSNTLTVLADNMLLFTNASSYSLANNNISVIAANALLTNSSPDNNVDYNLSNNAITSTTLSSGFLNGLKSANFPNKSIDLSYNNITTLNNSQLDIKSDNLNLSHNQITNLPATVFFNTRQSGHDMAIDLSYNQLTSIAAETFFGETVAQVDLSYNQIDTLETNFVRFGEDLTSLDLGYNLISDFNSSSIHQNRFNLNVQLNLTLDGNPLVLKANNFSGLDLDDLYLRSVNLTTVPAGTFAGVTHVDRIFLTDTNLTTLSAGSFSAAPGLDDLYLNNNQLTSISVDAFGTISTLTNIYLGDNNLTAVQPNTFSKLTNLQTLDLSNNALTNLSVNALQGLTATSIDLSDNQISVLPTNLLLNHTNPANITSFDLSGNLLTDDSWEITNVSWVEGSSGEFTLQLGHALPINITVPLSSGNGALNVTQITITKGQTSSNSVSWTASDAVTTQAHILPAMTTYQVPALSGHLVLEEYGSLGICSRTQAIIDILLTAVSGTNCANVVPNLLSALTGSLDISNQNITTLQTSDLAYLSNITLFNLDNNNIDTLLDYTFSTTAATTISLSNNNLSAIQVDALHTSINGDDDVSVNLSSNAITADTLSSGFLTASATHTFVGGSFDLSDNQITTLAVASFADFNPASLYLHNNSIATIEDNALAAATGLETLNLANNQLSIITAATFNGLAATAIDLSNNNIASLPINLLINHTNPAAITAFDLSGNTVQSWQITQANWTKSDNDTSQLVLPHALPMDITVSLSSQTGTLNPNVITILSGDTDSQVVTWTGDANSALEIIPAQSELNITVLGGYVTLSGISEAPSFTGSIDNQTIIVDHTFTPITLPTATGGDGALSYSLRETNGTNLPASLVFDPSTRMLSGSVDTAGNYSLTYSVQDAEGDIASMPFTLAVLPNLQPEFPAADDLIFAVVEDEAVNLTLPAASEGNGAVTYTLNSLDDLPAGLSFNATERSITGSTNATGTYTFTYAATDSLDDDSSSLNISIMVEAQLTPIFDATELFDNMTMRQDVAQFQIELPTASGGNGELSYSFSTNGTAGLPAGLVFNTTSLMIEGKPEVFGAFNITVTVEDADITDINDSTSFSFTLTLLESLGFATDLAETYSVVSGALFAVTLPVGQGGVPSYTYDLVGTLPAGLSFDATNRQLSGTSNSDGDYNLTYTVTDNDGFTHSQQTALVVALLAPSFLASISDIEVQLGQSINLTLPAVDTDGQIDITYSISDAPAGISFNAVTRQLTGAPTELGTHTITYNAIDTANQPVEQSFDVRVTTNRAVLQDIMWRQALAIADQTVNSVKKRFALVNQQRLPFTQETSNNGTENIGANFQITESAWLGLWLNVGANSLANKDDTYSWDGSTGVTQLGIDFSGKGYLVGLTSETVSTSSSFTVTGDEFDYTGDLDISGLGLLSLYGGYYQPKYDVWAITSSGSGSADLSVNAENTASSLSAGVDYSMLAVGGQYKLANILAVGFEGITSAALDFSDDTISSISSNSASRNKFFGSIDFARWTASKSPKSVFSWSPKLDLALRSDSGDGGSSSGLETTIAVQFKYNNFNFELGSRNFAAGDFSESGQWLSFTTIPTSKIGLNFAHRQQFGNSGSAKNSLLSDRALTDVVAGMRQSDTVTSISTIAYGWNVKAGSLQLYSKGESSYADSTAENLFQTKADIKWEHIGLSFDSSSSKYSWNAEVDPTAISFKAKIRF